MDLRTSAETGGAKQADVMFPTVHLSIAIDPQSVTPDGDLHYAWHVTSTSVDAKADTPTEVAEGMRTAVDEIDHLSGSAIVTSRGLAKEVLVDSAEPGVGGGLWSGGAI